MAVRRPFGVRGPLAAVVVLALLASACGGPEDPFEVGTREFPVDILLGEQQTPAPPAPVRSNPTPVAFPGFVEPPAHRPEPGAPPPVREGPPTADCPAAHPFEAALLAAGPFARQPPVVASYTFRNNGYLEVAGAERIDFPSRTTRAVTEVRALEGQDNYAYDLEAEVGGPLTTTTYRVVNSGDTPDRGLYIARVRTGDDVFTPQPPVLLLPFPPPELGTQLEDEAQQAAGQEYRSAGTDPSTRTTLAIEARVDGKERVDACGEWVDAWRVEVIAGRIVGPGKDLRFTGAVNVATQYGALVVQDDLHMEGTDGLDEVTIRNRASINEVPRGPRG